MRKRTTKDVALCIAVVVLVSLAVGCAHTTKDNKSSKAKKDTKTSVATATDDVSFPLPKHLARNPHMLLKSAFNLYLKGEYQQARIVAGYCLKNGMNRSDAYLLIGKCYYAERENNMAKVFLQKSIEANRGNGEAYVIMAAIAFDEKNILRAHYYLNKGKPYNYGNPLFYHYYGVLYYSLGSPSKASVHFAQAINLNPRFGASYGGLIRCLEDMDKKELAANVKRDYERVNK
ncbi:MAG TPA: hypothetical protein PLG31_12905 [Spirochaetota bacterium]|nr:hypothetical protein [Spirochaetota bacterium]HPU89690.1 hypothetical protein [Spirochaetota bacterium]